MFLIGIIFNNYCSINLLLLACTHIKLILDIGNFAWLVAYVFFLFRSPANARGVFKIPKLSTQHFNINVYSQVEDRNDNSYVEVSIYVIMRFSVP